MARPRSPAVETILAELRTGRRMTVAQMAELTGLARENVSGSISHLLKTGEVIALRRGPRAATVYAAPQRRSPAYQCVIDALAEGRRLTVPDVVALTGYDARGAAILLGNLKMSGEARVAGRMGRRAIYVRGERARAPSGARPPEAAPPSAPDSRALALLLRAFRIGPPPARVPIAPRLCVPTPPQDEHEALA